MSIINEGLLEFSSIINKEYSYDCDLVFSDENINNKVLLTVSTNSQKEYPFSIKLEDLNDSKFNGDLVGEIIKNIGEEKKYKIINDKKIEISKEFNIENIEFLVIEILGKIFNMNSLLHIRYKIYPV